MRNKTDRNDARGIAHLIRLGWFRVVHVKSEQSQQIRMLLVNRNLLLGKLQDIENSLRGSLKVFGLRLGQVTKHSFEARILELVAGHPSIAAITEPLLRVRRVLLDEFCRLDRMAIKTARNARSCDAAPGLPTRRARSS
jgi:transposase